MLHVVTPFSFIYFCFCLTLLCDFSYGAFFVAMLPWLHGWQEPLPILAEASAALREQISRQEFSAADMEGQLSERQRLRDTLDGAGEAKLKARKVCGCMCGKT